MTELEIQNGFARDMNRWGLLMPNYTPAGWYECDLFAVTKAGYLSEYEIKTSRPDFFADANKCGKEVFMPDYSVRKVEHNKHDRLASGDILGPSRFFFVVPRDMITVEEVPDWAGLYFVDAYEDYPSKGNTWLSFHKVKDAPRLHKSKVPGKVMEHARGVCYYRFWTERLKRTA